MRAQVKSMVRFCLILGTFLTLETAKRTDFELTHDQQSKFMI